MKLRNIKNSFSKGNFDILLLQETRTDGSDKELKKWQKIFNTKHIYFTSFGTRSVGAGIIVRSKETFNVHHYFSDPQGRYVGIVGDHEEGKFLILSFYSPSIEREIKDFVINHIYTQLNDMGEELPQFLILGGDTNTVFHNLDKQGGNCNLKHQAINAFNTLQEKFKIFDSFRYKNPNKCEFSWETLNPIIIRERIDVIFLSNSLKDYITESGIIPAHKTCSDHGIPFVKISGFGITSRGPGVWKFNNQLVEDSCFVAEMKIKVPTWTSEAEDDLPDNIGGQWGFIKHKIGEFSREYGAKIKKAKVLLKSSLEKELQTLSKNLNEANKGCYKSLQNQLNEIIENEIKGSILRSLCKEYEEGEKCSRYFFSLEKFKAKQKTLSRIKLADGSFSSNEKLILEECRKFYIKLYSRNENVNSDTFPFFFQNVSTPKLSEEQKQYCDTNLTENELFTTLKTFQKNKSPGLDGITAEFYLQFWNEIKLKLINVYDVSFTMGILPESLRIGLITLLEKKGKDCMEIANWRPITLLNIDYKLLTKTLGQRLKKVFPGLIHKDQNGFVPGGSIFYSSHTIRDILFYCKKENIDLILLALDYSKAFDSVDFLFIHNTFQLFNFGENFKKWIKIIYNGGKSCISNNGHISESFEIKRSTRQGDPISPLVFILCLEILVITLRSNENIGGIKVENNEIKLTAYADDATYFMKNKQSTEILLSTIEKFSKVSGLEVNRSKSECLLMNFEHDAAGNCNTFLGVPVVENIKILGHYHGKSRMVCDFQNFYNKLTKMTNILSMWKQRYLTIFGKNLLINSLSNSLFIFNAQIDLPPNDFIKLADKQNKDFLWGGTAKIAHHSIIADFQQGGINYKDLASLISSINLKFVFNLSKPVNHNQCALPKMWIKTLFKIPINNENENQVYFKNFFANELNIFDCKLKIPRQATWRGHPFYYQMLKTFEAVTRSIPHSLENTLSIPIWFNRHLQTTFDVELCRAGFNFIKDFFPSNQLIEMNDNKLITLRATKLRLLKKILLKIPGCWVEQIEEAGLNFVTISPIQTINLNDLDVRAISLSSFKVYSILISDKIRMPRGLVRWCEQLHLTDEQIKTSLTFAKKCSKSVFDQVFQFKIVTQILPTNEYLKRYKVKESDACSRCLLETVDTVLHSTWSCPRVYPYIVHVLKFLREGCGVEVEIEMFNYIFGFHDLEHLGLNQILLQLKKEIFYNWKENVSIVAFLNNFKLKIIHLIIKEKQIAISRSNFVNFEEKWQNYCEIYDFRGPDCQII